MATDLAQCRAILARDSKSFALASRLLPRRLRDPVAAFYAFCRVSDDAIDESRDPAAALVALRARLDAIYVGAPLPLATDRALAAVVAEHRLARAPLDALLEGYAWDASAKRYADLPALREYAVRVAASVGVAMTILMGVRRAAVLARAADLGVAMQLTNIARDVGEDAQGGRVYLPLEWLAAEGVDPEAFLRTPRYSPAIGVTVCRVLDAADGLYARAEAGIAELPADCRPAIRAARLIYADIGREIRRARYDSVSRRAVTSRTRKSMLAGLALFPARRVRADEAALPEARALIEAVS